MRIMYVLMCGMCDCQFEHAWYHVLPPHYLKNSVIQCVTQLLLFSVLLFSVLLFSVLLFIAKIHYFDNSSAGRT